MRGTLVRSLHRLRVADEAWIALALLHREDPKSDGFSAREILDRVKAASAYPDLRAGLQPHISLHNVANLPSNSARYRLFYRTPEGTYRLFRPGDDFHPSRTGKTKPERAELPEQFHDLLDWYETSYCVGAGRKPPRIDDDPFLQMRGAGKEVWAGINADEYVRKLRAGWGSAKR